MRPDIKAPITVDQAVPHEEQMSLLGKIDDFGEDWLHASAEISVDNPFLVATAGVPSWVGIEYMAQAVAAYAGVLSVSRGEKAKVGLLLGTRRYSVDTAFFELGAKLNIHVTHLMTGENGLGAFDCTLSGRQGDGGLFEGGATLNVYQPDNIDHILRENL